MPSTVVSDVSGLTAALRSAQSGDTILLNGGTYNGHYLQHLSFPTGVTITSVDPAHRAVLDYVNLSDVHGLTFSNLEFLASQPNYAGIEVDNSSELHFDRVYIHGSLDGNSGNDANGMRVLYSSNVSLTNSELEQLGRGSIFGITSGVHVSGNHIHDIRTDGLDFAEVSYVKILNNLIHDIVLAPGDHPDGIQFWTSGTTHASHDILISGNVILRGGGGWTEGIFLYDEVGTLPYQRLTITDNLIVGTGYNAIRVIGAKDLVVSGNQLVSFADDPMKTFFLLERSDSVVSSNNSAIAIGFDGVTNLTQSGDRLTEGVSDKGQAAIVQWSLTHPDTFALIAPFLPPPPPPPPPATVAVAEVPTWAWGGNLGVLAGFGEGFLFS